MRGRRSTGGYRLRSPEAPASASQCGAAANPPVVPHSGCSSLRAHTRLGDCHERTAALIDPDANLDEQYQSEAAEPDWYKTNIPCQVGCPAHTDVSTYIGLISQARFDEAYLLNRKANVVPGVLGRTCARPCEPVCRRNKIDGKPIAICWLKRAAADHREFRHHAERPPITKDKTVAIVGAGSAGLACARDLRGMGYAVTLYDEWPTAGGVMVNGIPIWRLPRS